MCKIKNQFKFERNKFFVRILCCSPTIDIIYYLPISDITKDFWFSLLNFDQRLLRVIIVRDGDGREEEKNVKNKINSLVDTIITRRLAKTGSNLHT